MTEVDFELEARARLYESTVGTYSATLLDSIGFRDLFKQSDEEATLMLLGYLLCIIKH